MKNTKPADVEITISTRLKAEASKDESKPGITPNKDIIALKIIPTRAKTTLTIIYLIPPLFFYTQGKLTILL